MTRICNRAIRHIFSCTALFGVFPAFGQHEGHEMKPPAKKAQAKPKSDQKAMPMQHEGHTMPAKPGEMQHGMEHNMAGMEIMAPFAGIPMTREASGTAWQPDSTPMHAKHGSIALWRTMQHFN